MQSDEPIPEQPGALALSGPSNWRHTALALVLTTLLAGTGGYLLGTRNGQLKQSAEWVSPTPPRHSLYPTLPQTDNASSRHICQVSYAMSPDGARLLTVKVDSNYHRHLIIEDLSSTSTPSHELALFDAQVNADLWEPVTDDNWSPDGTYVYLLDTLYEGASDLYVFKSNGEPFGNKRKYLLASELGYDPSPIGSIRWTSPTQIAFRAWPLPGPIEPSLPLLSSEYLFNIEKQAITRIK